MSEETRKALEILMMRMERVKGRLYPDKRKHARERDAFDYAITIVWKMLEDSHG